MALNSYERIPKSVLTFRALLLAGGAGVVVFLGLGVAVGTGIVPSAARVQVASVFSERALGIQHPSVFDSNSAQRQPASATSSAESFLPWTLAAEHISRTATLWLHLPESCLVRAESDFQKAQCETFWNELFEASLYGLAPIVAFLLAFSILGPRLKEDYRKFRRAIRIGRASYVGKLDSITRKKRDTWAWSHALRPLQVNRPGAGKQTVYWPEKLALPARGTEVAVYSLGMKQGRKRYIAQVYLPHVSVIGSSNSRR